ncbi:MAG: HDIG domain-containing protein [Algoriphagus sp.]|uniref:phosphonate degradation HD-domain oxygenase n=1 Tax=Algoriphagus sp. TaxID=1872435 RepID=UPI002607F55C|nr:phosphonate degradation HD-domain oxygenase [Algoriphagus sp.]MDG1277780.1 HDIG domain-containing protein [Algoriphagus sp.]
MKNLEKAIRVHQVFELYERFGSADYIGEPVSQLEHMAQSAQLAEKEGYDSAIILAAFFHDIGHLLAQDTETESMGGYGVKSHEQIGADFLRENGFPERVAKLVENHVQAKRYLTFRYPDYLAKLSEASLKTLEYQGGAMNAEEAEGFEKDPLFEVSLKMRSWDEAAKEVQVPIPDLNKYKEMAKEVLDS